MAENNFPIPGHEDDKIIIFVRRHWASLIKTVLLIFVLILVPPVIMLALRSLDPALFQGLLANFFVIGFSIYYLVIATYTFTEWISFYYDIFIMTDEEIIDIEQKGIFNRRVSEVSILRIQDVSAQVKGFLQTFFGYGDVVAESAGEKTQTYVIDCVPNPGEIANKIMHLHQQIVAKEEREPEVLRAEGDLRGQKPPAQKEPQPIEEIPEPKTEFQDIEPPPPAESSKPVQASEPVKPREPKPPSEPSKTDTKQTENSNNQGDISRDDLQKGGEIKFE